MHTYYSRSWHLQISPSIEKEINIRVIYYANRTRSKQNRIKAYDAQLVKSVGEYMITRIQEDWCEPRAWLSKGWFDHIAKRNLLEYVFNPSRLQNSLQKSGTSSIQQWRVSSSKCFQEKIIVILDRITR